MSRAKAVGRLAGVRTFKPYPEYKDSGVEWLGHIPVHWKSLSLAYITVSRCDGPFGSGLKSEHYSGEGVRVIRLQNIGCAEFSDSDAAYISEAYASELGDHSVLGGDLLIAGLGDEGHPVGRACTAPAGIEPAMVKADCFRFRLDRRLVLPGFAAYQLSTTASAAAGSLATGATRSRMNLTTTAARKAALPPLDEQDAIKVFLDRQTAKIDALVAKKERLIELLEEKRAALITRTVTKGLDPNVPMKDSGVEWLGDIPAHWNVAGLARWWKVIDCKHRTVPFLDEGVPLASIGEVQSLEVDLSAAKRTSLEEYGQMISGGRDPRRGDIIYSRNVTVGAAALVTIEEPFCMGQDVTLIRAADQDPRFLVFLLRSPAITGQLDSLMVGSTFNRINVSEIKKLLVCVPPLGEQRRIAEFCQGEHRKSEQLVLKIQNAVDRLRELRTALISAAVTGKIDVRGASSGAVADIGGAA